MQIFFREYCLVKVLSHLNKLNTDLFKTPVTPTSKVLVIDHNEEITGLLKDYFEIENIQCKVINDGREGLAELRNGGKEKYAIVLLDIAIPDFSGFDIFSQLKKENLLNNNNVIIFTALSKNMDEFDRMLRDGAKYVLRKPFSIVEIKKLVETFTTIPSN